MTDFYGITGTHIIQFAAEELFLLQCYTDTLKSFMQNSVILSRKTAGVINAGCSVALKICKAKCLLGRAVFPDL